MNYQTIVESNDVIIRPIYQHEKHRLVPDTMYIDDDEDYILYFEDDDTKEGMFICFDGVQIYTQQRVSWPLRVAKTFNIVIRDS